MARVFAGDLVGFLENTEGAEGDVFQIADGGADEVEAAAGIGRRDLHGRSLAWGSGEWLMARNSSRSRGRAPKTSSARVVY